MIGAPHGRDLVVPQKLRIEQFLTEGVPSLRLYQDCIDWEACDLVDWEQACAQLTLDAMDMVQAGAAKQPAPLIEARVLTEAEKAGYPDWLQPYRAGQLFKKPHQWQRFFAENNEPFPTRLSRWMADGYSAYIDLQGQKPQPKESQLTAAELQFAKGQVQKWMDMGAIRVFDEKLAHKDARICNCVVAYRNNVMDRICWSGVPVNEGMDDQSFRMEGVKEICSMVQPGDWAFTFDLEKGFQQIPLKGKFAMFCLFRLDGVVYQWLVLPQGLKSAPRDFSYIVRSILKILRKQGIRCAFYIDDIKVLARSRAEALRLQKHVMNIFYQLGFRVSLKKSLLSPGQLVAHLGFVFDLHSGVLWVTDAKAQRIKELAIDMLRDLGNVDGYKVAKFLGVLQSNGIVITLAKMFSTGLIRCMSQLPMVVQQQRMSRTVSKKWRFALDAVPDYALRDYEGRIVLSDWAIAELRFWCKCIWHMRHDNFCRLVERLILTDACPKGYGAVICSLTNLGAPLNPVFSVSDLLHGAWLSKCNAHSTTFELRTMVRVLLEEAQQLKGKRVHCATDNVGAAHIAIKGCKANLRLHYWACILALMCRKLDIKLTTQYLCGDGIIVSGADALSRQADPYACMLQRSVFLKIWDELGPLHVDVWASDGARQASPLGVLLPCVSPFDVPGRLAPDAMSFLDKTKRLYAFPPANMLGPYIEFVVRHKQPVVLVVPKWCSRPWYAVLVQVGSKWLRLGKVSEVIIQNTPRSHPFGREFDRQEALDTVLWAVSLFTVLG